MFYFSCFLTLASVRSAFRYSVARTAPRNAACNAHLTEVFDLLRCITGELMHAKNMLVERFLFLF